MEVPITFDTERLNIGSAMKSATGIFIAPRAGTYLFSFSAMVVMPEREGSGHVNVGFNLNGNIIGRAGGSSQNGRRNMNGDASETLSLQATLNLNIGDTVWLAIIKKAPTCYLRGDYYNHFTGLLLHEDTITP